MERGISSVLLPKEKNLFPPFDSSSQQWVIEDLPYYDTQLIECSYPISGGYGPTPRYVYYAFILLAVFGRNTAWITNAALGLVMTFSSAAAIHGIILAIIRENLVPGYLREYANNWEVVQVDGQTFLDHQTNEWLYNKSTNETWLPVIPMAWDNDGDAILAIVGSAYLVLLPMQLWSKTLQESAPRKKWLLGLWSCLLLGGLISALIYVAYVLVWVFPQLRFCPPDTADILPFHNRGSYTSLPEQTPGDWYRWNRIVGEEFVYKNSSMIFPNKCIYPCLGFEWPLHDPEDVYVTGGVIEFMDAQWWALVAIYFTVGSSTLCNLLLLLATQINVLTRSRSGLDPRIINLMRQVELLEV